MNLSRTANRLLLLVTLGFLGFLMVFVPPWVLRQYETIKQLGDWAVYAYFGVVGVGAVLLGGVTIWTIVSLIWRSWKKHEKLERKAKNPSQLSEEEQRREVDDNLQRIGGLGEQEAIDEDVKLELRALVQDLEDKRETKTLEIVAFGTISSGKSSLLNALAGRNAFATDPKGGTTIRRGEAPWPGADHVVLVDTPGLGEIEGADNIHEAAKAAKDADLVLLVVDGPLRESEHRLLAKLGEMEKRVFVCLNKGDWFDATERQSLHGQLCEQLRSEVRPEDVIAVQSAPGVRTRIKVLADDREVEEEVETPPDISQLADRMLRVISKDGRDLLLANLLLQSRGLVEEAQQRVREALDRRAWELVDKYMWSAGGAAALSPLPVLDLAAGTAITVKMVLDLGRVYGQEMDIETATNLLAQMGKNLISILGVSAATPAVASGVASVLKSVPGAGTIAGGVLQGVVQAIVTRWIGAVFIEYFQNEAVRGKESLAAMARKKWDLITSVVELRKVVQAAREQGKKGEAESP